MERELTLAEIMDTVLEDREDLPDSDDHLLREFDRLLQESMDEY
jgi:hypothetical protein